MGMELLVGEKINLERIRQCQSQANKRMTSSLECDSAEFSLILYNYQQII